MEPGFPRIALFGRRLARGGVVSLGCFGGAFRLDGGLGRSFGGAFGLGDGLGHGFALNGALDCVGALFGLLFEGRADVVALLVVGVLAVVLLVLGSDHTT